MIAQADFDPASSEFLQLATALWERECQSVGINPHDRRLVEQLPLAEQPANAIDIAGVPSGIDGIAWLANRYLTSLPTKIKSEYGRFYTPPSLAAILAEVAFSNASCCEGLVVDPACGAGSLLAAATMHIGTSQEPAEALRSVAHRVRGTDLDPLAVALCEFAVRIALLPTWARASAHERPVLPAFAAVADGLKDKRPASIVLANPPFGRRRLTPAERAAHADVLYGHAHWPTLFLHAAVERLTAPGAVAAFLLPASMVGGAYYQRLREYLISAAPPAWLGFVRDRSGVFAGDVLQEALLGSFVRGRADPEVTIEQIALNGKVEREAHHVSRHNWVSDEPWLIPRATADIDLVRTASRHSNRLRDYGWKVSTGPLVWNRHKAQLFDIRGRSRLPVIWASDLRGGQIDVTGLRPGRFFEPKPRQDWLVLNEPAVLVQRTTAPEQPRRLVAAILDRETLTRLGGRVVVENHLNVCLWDGTGPLTADHLYAYLMSEDADRLYRCMTGSVAVSAFELSALPIPDPRDAAEVADDNRRQLDRQAA